MSPGTGPNRPVAPARSRSIVADLDVPERDLSERPHRLVPRSSALVFVGVLVLAVAGGGGYLAWRQMQVEEPVEAPTEIEPAPEPAAPPEVVPEEVPPQPGPEVPAEVPAEPPAPEPTAPEPTAPKASKTSKSGSSAKKPAKSGTSAKTGTSTKDSTPKKTTPAEDSLSKRKEQADAADPGRVLVELEYLSAIDKALKAGNWAQALAYIDQHDRELPGGQLVDKFDERRIRALCGMGRASEAQSKAAQILAKRPSSKVKTALAESCK